MQLSFDMVGVTRGDFQAARSHAHHEQGEFDEHFDNTVMLNSLAKHSMSPLKVQMTALKRDVGGPFTMKHCSE